MPEASTAPVRVQRVVRAPDGYPTDRLICPHCGAWMERETSALAAFACGAVYKKAVLTEAETAV